MEATCGQEIGAVIIGVLSGLLLFFFVEKIVPPGWRGLICVLFCVGVFLVLAQWPWTFIGESAAVVTAACF